MKENEWEFGGSRKGCVSLIQTGQDPFELAMRLACTAISNHHRPFVLPISTKRHARTTHTS